MAAPELIVEREDGYAVLTLNRPQAMNALSPQLIGVASCVPETVKVYKQMVNDGLKTSLAAGLAMERSVMAHANKGVSGDIIAARRAGIQQRGKEQKSA
jgi:enoyl-CoA hydratase/carnithine racemase